MPNWITDTAYTEDSTGRSNVGDAPERRRLAVLDAASGEMKWVDHGQKAAPPASAPAIPADRAAPPEREVDLGMPVWSEDGSKAALLGRSADNKDRWIFALDPATGKTRVLAHDHDDAWIGGPAAQFTLGWMKNGREVYFQSERTGYSHLYAVALGGRRAARSDLGQLGSAGGAPVARQVAFLHHREQGFALRKSSLRDERRRRRAHPPHQPARQAHHHGFARRALDRRRLLLHQPAARSIRAGEPAAAPNRGALTTSPAPDFAAYPWLDVPIVTFTARDGVEVPARLFKPAHFRKGGPGVVFVHGAGYLQNVDRWWSANYYREYMFDHLLMERGFIVIDVDYRGSAGYGRDWRTAIYEHMGGKDLDDITDAAQYLVARHGANPRKIGLWGGSYGGFLTLMAMFTQGDTFAAGAALRPVSDWALYNHGYTSDILNLPQSDTEAYRRSSPIFFAEGLKGALLICHGMVDTNVEFNDTVRLVQRLIELRKENWQARRLSGGKPRFTEPTSWADEYKRILALFEKNLK